jgi:hypothetical protein
MKAHRLAAPLGMDRLPGVDACPRACGNNAMNIPGVPRSM